MARGADALWDSSPQNCVSSTSCSIASGVAPMNNIYQVKWRPGASGGKGFGPQLRDTLQQHSLSDMWHLHACMCVYVCETEQESNCQSGWETTRDKRWVQHMCEQINCSGNYDRYHFLWCNLRNKRAILSLIGKKMPGLNILPLTWTQAAGINE